MRNGYTEDIAKLIEPGRVHRRVYTDPELFELEMERIFESAWLFVGHTSQVPKPGDYITTELGRQPAEACRHSDGMCRCCSTAAVTGGAKVVNELAVMRPGSCAAITAGLTTLTEGCCPFRSRRVAAKASIRRRFGLRTRTTHRRLPRLYIREVSPRPGRALRIISAQ
jgi:hypothetical protein